MNARHLIAVLCFSALSLCLGGCGGSDKVHIKGRLHNNGQPLTFGAGGGPPPTIDLKFNSKSTPHEFSAAVDSGKGTFDVPNDVPPGAYEVTMKAIPYGSGGKDVTGGKYATKGKSSLTYTATTDRMQEVVIDIGKGTITKQGS